MKMGRVGLTLLVFASCTAFVVFFGWKFQAQQTARAQEITRLARANAALEARLSRLSKKAAAEKRVAVKTSISKASTAAKTKAAAISSLFDAAEQADAPTLDALKQRYEGLFVTYLFHARCNQATPADYSMLSIMLHKELLPLGAPAGFQQDVLSAAQSSFREVYATVACDSTEGVQNAAKFREYMRKVRAQDEFP